jgi:hypothetical protein
MRSKAKTVVGIIDYFTEAGIKANKSRISQALGMSKPSVSDENFYYTDDNGDDVALGRSGSNPYELNGVGEGKDIWLGVNSGS